MVKLNPPIFFRSKVNNSMPRHLCKMFLFSWKCVHTNVFCNPTHPCIGVFWIFDNLLQNQTIHSFINKIIEEILKTYLEEMLIHLFLFMTMKNVVNQAKQVLIPAQRIIYIQLFNDTYLYNTKFFWNQLHIYFSRSLQHIFVPLYSKIY